MKSISIQELKELLDTKHLDHKIIIDVRTPGEHNAGHIPCAINMPLDDIEKQADVLRKYDVVYVHCQSGNRSGLACERLETLGLGNLVSVDGGMNEWEEDGFTVARGSDVKCRLPIMRQVLLAAGTLILLGFLLALFSSAYFLAIPVFVGCGLALAGLTGWCPMMAILTRMPWNK